MDYWFYNIIRRVESAPMAAEFRTQKPDWMPTGPVGEALVDVW